MSSVVAPSHLQAGQGRTSPTVGFLAEQPGSIQAVPGPSLRLMGPRPVPSGCSRVLAIQRVGEEIRLELCVVFFYT